MAWCGSQRWHLAYRAAQNGEVIATVHGHLRQPDGAMVVFARKYWHGKRRTSLAHERRELKCPQAWMTTNYQLIQTPSWHDSGRFPGHVGDGNKLKAVVLFARLQKSSS